jgi:hypothetical protein
MKQQMNKNHTITHVNVSAKICLPEGSLSRLVERALSLESMGRYGILIWNKERYFSTTGSIKRKVIYKPTYMTPIICTGGPTSPCLEEQQVQVSQMPVKLQHQFWWVLHFHQVLLPLY